MTKVLAARSIAILCFCGAGATIGRADDSLIAAMPYARAQAYATAARTFCFDEVLDDAGIRRAAELQDALTHTTSSQASNRLQLALSHLMADQSACAPAVAFIERAIGSVSKDLTVLKSQYQVVVDQQVAEEKQGWPLLSSSASKIA
ncbi:hypothetical protein NKH34_09295 [Mesorhizobium sp. M1148]|uniref:hypothetical protein n=1 Tax=unclassified Mesorhizobium TaxID=325217 RepID=UPI00333C2FDE